MDDSSELEKVQSAINKKSNSELILLARDTNDLTILKQLADHPHHLVVKAVAQNNHSDAQIITEILANESLTDSQKNEFKEIINQRFKKSSSEQIRDKTNRKVQTTLD